ncbi:hypothetical protein HY416_01270 [Candidatus Kaiserbacteria bacterium]|nr:hypothetical protein [Candidatus Kaiserbacteria bacterium]
MDICVFGDSITHGASDYKKGGWVERLKAYCMEKYADVSIYNLGISGDTSSGVLRRFKVEAEEREPDITIFAVGINDSRYAESKEKRQVSADVFEKNLAKLLFLSRKIADKVMFVGLTEVDESKTMPILCDIERYYDNESVREYNGIIENCCEKNDVEYVSMKGVVVADDLEDGLHPNSHGHEKMFQAVLKKLDTHLHF